MTLGLTLGCKRYPWIDPLLRETVTPTGIDLTVVDGLISPEYFAGILEGEEFDAAELSLGAYLAIVDRPEYDLRALPVFPHRRFRHASVYVREGSDVETPADLTGGTVGMVNWEFAAGLWIRGILQERHGLDLRSVDWRLAGSDPVPVDPGGGFSISDLSQSTGDAIDPVEEGGSGALRRLERALAAGHLDAVITPTEYRNDALRRLFDDAFERERVYYEQTRIFPIMHLVVVEGDLLDDQPWVAESLYDAFEAALATARADVDGSGWFKRSPLVWSLEAVERERDLFEDSPWEYGLTERNRTTLSKAIEYAHDQGIVDRRPDVADLFVDGIDI